MNADPSPAPSWRLVVAACTLAAFALLAWVAAHWIWRWVSPKPPQVATTAPADPAATILASGLWTGGTDLSTPAGAPVPGELRLLGVLAERDGKGWAVFRTREGARVVAAGGEVVAGTTLVSIGPSSVTLRDATGERRVELRRDDVAKPAAAPAARGDPSAKVATAPGRSTTPACAIPAGFSGVMLKLHAELLDGLIAQPDTWRGMLSPEGGALVVREDGGFAAMLGLAKGDRIAQANGIALREPDDVTSAVLRPLAANQPVRVSGARAGQARDLLIVNASACP
jgi:hypothetical protein